MGKPVDLEAIRNNIILRDRKDSSRKMGPLICPDDATRIDTSGMTLDDVVDLLERGGTWIGTGVGRSLTAETQRHREEAESRKGLAVRLVAANFLTSGF